MQKLRIKNMDLQGAVDNTDWLKATAIILVAVDHFGYFFMEDNSWWSVFGRFAAPVFFFLMGYAQRRHVPFKWLWLGAILTLLESWNADWTWVAPNIFFSFILIRLVRSYVLTFLKHQGWFAFIFIAVVLIAVLPFAAKVIDYGTEGWLWAFFGLCQRLVVDSRSITEADGIPSSQATPVRGLVKSAGRVRLVACLVAAVVYIWQEQKEYAFPGIQLAVVILGIGVLSFCLCLFLRGRSPIQPLGPIAVSLRFMGRHTLEIYAIQLAVSELMVKLVPYLTP
jgi:peptidoglycan/LPS O-acetylase OafA/YrhL